MRREQVLAFRLSRHRLDTRGDPDLAEAAACPVSEVSRGTGLLALGARSDRVTGAEYRRAVDDGRLIVAPTLRAALHLVAADDLGRFGRDLIAEDGDGLLEQLGSTARRHLGVVGVPVDEALAEVADATAAAFAGGRSLSRDALHDELRGRVRGVLLPWCPGCDSHHVSPMLWRYAGVKVGMRLDSSGRMRGGGLPPPGEAADAARRFLSHYGPSTRDDFRAWAGLSVALAASVWKLIETDLEPVDLEGRGTWLLAKDVGVLASPPTARGVRLLPPRDPYLQQPDRATLVPDPKVRKRLFRPVAGPGAVLVDGRLVGLWRQRLRQRRLEIEVEALEPIARPALEVEAARLADLREAAAVTLRWR